MPMITRICLATWLGLATIAAPLASHAQAGLPALGEASVDELSLAAERRLGQAVFHELVRAGAVFDDPELQDYLQAQAWRLLRVAVSQGSLTDRLGGSASALSAQEFFFFPVRDSSINAFALPGGWVGVHTGLITAAQTESELMSVLAHEIGHVTQRHIARMFGEQRQASAWMIAAAVLAAAAASQSADAAAGVLSLGQTVAVRQQLAFSQNAEREADRVGFSMLTGAGFDGKGMVGLFEKLMQAGRFYESSQAPTWLRTHPLTSERVADMRGRLGLQGSAAQQAIVKDSVEFGWIRSRLMAQSDRSVDGLNRMLGLMREDLKGAGPAKAAALHYGMAWAHLARRDSVSALDSARQAGQQAQAAGQSEWVAALLMQLDQAIAWAQMDVKRVMALGQTMLDQHPRAVSLRAALRLAAQAGLESAQSEDMGQSLQKLQLVTQRWPSDSEAWRLLAAVNGQLQRRAAAHAASAEQYALSGGWQAAIEQLEMARRAGDADFVMLSKIDARLSLFRRRLQEAKANPIP
jgi:predicted Zn-dependent protease